MRGTAVMCGSDEKVSVRISCETEKSAIEVDKNGLALNNVLELFINLWEACNVETKKEGSF